MGSPTERVLQLAGYVKQHQSGELTLSKLTLAVPGYPSVDRDSFGDIVSDTKGWETARKALQRDLRDLEEQLGIVVEYDSSFGHYRLVPPFFTAEERLALVSACAAVDVEGVPDSDAGELGGAVDAASRRAILWVHRRVVDFQEARQAHAAVTFRYHGRDRVFDPYAVGVWRNRWYVVGHEHGVEDLRLFRLDRIESADDEPVRRVEGAEPFEVPDNFDAPRALRLDPNDWGKDPPVDARVRVSNDRLSAFQRELGGRVVEQHGDHAIVEVTVRHRASFRVRLIAFEDGARLLGPDELVDDLAGWLAGVAQPAGRR